ncbi:hypothetical protein, partial [Escherichia coli]
TNNSCRKSQQPERTVLITTSEFIALLYITDTKKPPSGGFLVRKNLHFASRYSFAKLTGIQAVSA